MKKNMDLGLFAEFLFRVNNLFYSKSNTIHFAFLKYSYGDC